ncbi:MAG: hypothetical protein KG012_17620 [Deltaproteobacteria bacterium]|nr:hypothetical protein [Deltaproteobacteria bacterium]
MTRKNGISNLFDDLIGYLVGSIGSLKQGCITCSYEFEGARLSYKKLVEDVKNPAAELRGIKIKTQLLVVLILYVSTYDI